MTMDNAADDILDVICVCCGNRWADPWLPADLSQSTARISPPGGRHRSRTVIPRPATPFLPQRASANVARRVVNARGP
jgi:hypothetical protein